MQINRLFEIVHILLNKETVTAKELADRFEVSVRTVYRDIETLSGSGIPIYMSKGRNGGISLLDGYVLNKAVLSQMEKNEILSALQGLSAVSCQEQGNALSKVGALLGESNCNWIEVDFSGWYNQELVSEIFASLKRAILNKQPVQFRYFNNKQECSVRTVEPLRLVFKEQAWYLFAYCRHRQDMRIFKLSRLKELSVLDERFTRSYTGTILGERTFKEEFVELKLKIAKQMAFRVFDEFDNSLIETDTNGDFIVIVRYPADSRWIFNYLMSFGESAEVLEPLNVREQIKVRLKKVLRQYL